MSTSKAEPPPPLAEGVPSAAPASDIKRDSGVCDAVWEQLQQDKQAAKEKDERYQTLLKASADVANNINILQQKEQASEQMLQQAMKHKEDQAALQEAKRLREEARLQHEMERRAQEELERQRKAEEEERRKEAKAQQKLRTLGICPAGYRWNKQNGGYRCGGGSHFMTDSQLGL